MDSLSTSIWHCWYLCRQTKIWISKSPVIPVLLYGCETWTLNTDLKRQIRVFGSKCLCRIMGYCWNDFVSNQRLLCKMESRPITSIVCQLNSGYMGMWHVTQKLILLVGLFVKEITQCEGGKRGTYKVLGFL